ncbi:hypothetical protein JZU71_03460 [bacterium]|nr:hypothetical protein [bacterium]
MKKWLVIGIVILGGLGAGIFYPNYKEPLTSRPQTAQHAITQKNNPSLQQLPASEHSLPHKQPTPLSSIAMQAKAVPESKITTALVEANPKPGLNSLPLPTESKRTLPDLRCNQDFSDLNVAKTIGTTGEKLLLLKKLRALTNQEICGLPNRAVSKILSRLNSPKPGRYNVEEIMAK